MPLLLLLKEVGHYYLNVSYFDLLKDIGIVSDHFCVDIHNAE